MLVTVISVAVLVSAAECVDDVTNPEDGTHEELSSLRDVIVTPSGVVIAPNGSHQFRAYGVTDQDDSVGVDVSWAATGGTITATGLYTAGERSGAYGVSATEAESGISGSAEVTVVDDGTGDIDGLWVYTGKAYRITEGLRATDTIPEDTVQQYIDRNREIRRMPTELEGLTFIQTANDDKNVADVDTFLAFDIPTRMTVLVAQTDRVTPKPAWLAAFEDTGEDLINEKDDTEEFSIYGVVLEPGRVVLGSNVTAAQADAPQVNMYTPIVGPPDLLTELMGTASSSSTSGWD